MKFTNQEHNVMKVMKSLNSTENPLINKYNRSLALSMPVITNIIHRGRYKFFISKISSYFQNYLNTILIAF